MTRATLKVWLEGDCVHSRLISGSSNALYEGATPLEPCQELASEWRSLLRGDFIDLEQQCKVGSSIAQTILPKNVYDGLTWIAGRHDGPSPISLGVDLSGPILECLPWELLRLPSFDGEVFLALLPHSSVYRLSFPAPTNLEGKEKCRILLAYANPGTPGFPTLAHLEREVMDLRHAFAKTHAAIEIIRLADAGPSTLSRALLSRSPASGFDIVHFCGHAVRSRSGGQLVLQGGREHELLEASEFADWLLEAGVQFVFLSACDTAGGSDSMAETLSRRGVPAVIGMQTRVRDETQAQLISEFYTELAKGYLVDEALSISRASRRYDPHWWAPVLCAVPGRQALLLNALAVIDEELPPDHLPRFASPFVGRSEDIDRLYRAFSSTGNSFITFIGLGGAGKSRLAIESARRLLMRVDAHGPLLPDGAFLVDCTGLTTASQLIAAIAAKLDLQLGSGDPAESLTTLLSQLRCIVILDCVDELVKAGCTSEIANLQCVTGARLFLTSRVALQTSDEIVLEVGPLQGSDDVGLDDSVALFLQSASFRAEKYDQKALRTIAGICRDLDRMPLAIQLIAARATIQPLEDVAEFVRSSPSFAIESMLKGTLELLSEEDRLLLARLAVFQGSFTVEDTAEVLDVPQLEVSQDLVRLSQYSLLQPYRENEIRRFRILDMIRDSLQKNGLGIPPADLVRFASIFTERAQRYRELEKTNRKDACEGLWRDLPNIQRALVIQIEQGDDDVIRKIVDTLLLPYLEAGLWEDLDHLLEVGHASADRLNDARLTIRMLGIAGALAARRGRPEELQALWQQRLDLSRAVGDAEGEADTLIDLGCQAVAKEHFKDANRLFDQAESALKRCDRPDMVATVAAMHARIGLDLKRSEADVMPFVAEAEAIADKAQEKDPLMFVFTNLARLYVRLDRIVEGKDRYMEVISLALEGSRKFHLQYALLEFSKLSRQLNQREEAVLAIIAAHKLNQSIISKWRQEVHDAYKAASTEAAALPILAECGTLSYSEIVDRLRNRRLG